MDRNDLFESYYVNYEIVINEIEYLYKNNMISIIIIDIEQLKLNEDDWDRNIEFIPLLFHWLNDSNIISFSSFISYEWNQYHFINELHKIIHYYEYKSQIILS